jgi:diphthamide synthase (EF-2-diphthine--ammonia ligase)
MTEPEGVEGRIARPASVEDLKSLLRALNDEGVEYLLIGGYALYALGYERGTIDIDLLLRPTREQGERTRRALLRLPDQVARELDPAWFTEGETIRVADAFVVDLMFTAGGQSIDSLQPHRVNIDFDGVTVSTIDLEGLLKTKQSARDKDKLDRAVLERAIEALKRGPAAG